MSLGFKLAAEFAYYSNISFSTPDVKDYKYGILIGVFSALVFLLFRIKNETTQYKLKTEAKQKDLESRTLKAKLNALTIQMSPHFLFNSLNSVSEIIHSDPMGAENFVLELSNFYRLLLETTKKESHSLEEEIKLCQAYLDLEKIRFPKKFNYQIEIEPHLKLHMIRVPVLILQPIVENSIKHGFKNLSHKGNLQIIISNSEIENKINIFIKDDGSGLHQNYLSLGSGTALENCKTRMKMMFGDHSEFNLSNNDPKGTITTICFPQQIFGV